jgi:N-acetylglutamate synthase-like GNAT family acetyltransferase
MTNGIFVRLAHDNEQKQLEALQWRASLNNAGDRVALLANPDAIVLPLEQITSGLVFVAERNGTTVGFAAVLHREDGQIELDALFVEPTLWRSGVGRALIEYCAAFAWRFGAEALHVIGNPHAQGFYMACGFEVMGRTETQFGTGLLMRSCVTAPK